MGKIVMLLTALLFNTLTGVVCASVLGFSPVAGAVGMNAVAAFMGMAPRKVLQYSVKGFIRKSGQGNLLRCSVPDWKEPGCQESPTKAVS
ncbi:hypothetical protein NXX20_16135 [Bacteroides stercoris]|nr:hypothetical protein [Bacteroides stercoris]